MVDILVTGASGFLGTAIVRHCLSAGCHVRGTGRAHLTSRAGTEYVPMDLLQPNGLPDLLRGVQTVIHAAGLTPFHGSHQVQCNCFRSINGRLTRTLLRGAVQEGVSHFILLSSVAVYGSPGASPCLETTTCAPDDPYGRSKHLGEHLALRLTAGTRTRLTILRIATAYGEGERGNILRLIRSIDQRRFIWVGEGMNRKTLLHRDDIARACLVAAHGPVEETGIYNIASPACTMREVVDVIAGALGRSRPRWRFPAAPLLGLIGAARLLSSDWAPVAMIDHRVKKWLADNVYDGSKFEREFNFAPQISLSDGLRREVSWYKGSMR